MANDDLDAFLRRASNYHGGYPEYFEDTHDVAGNYIGRQAQYGAPVPEQPTYTPTPVSPYSHQESTPRYGKYDPVGKTEQYLNNPPKIQYYDVPPVEKQKAVPLPKVDQYISPRMYPNILLYSPRSSADVEKLIDFLRRREPAIIDLDPIADSPDAQRVLDFTSGAVYALNGRILEIKNNTFLIVPEGVDVAKPENGN